MAIGGRARWPARVTNLWTLSVYGPGPPEWGRRAKPTGDGRRGRGPTPPPRNARVPSAPHRRGGPSGFAGSGKGHGAGWHLGRRRTGGINGQRLRTVWARGPERALGKSENWGVRCPTPLNNKVAGFGRLAAAFDPTGRECKWSRGSSYPCPGKRSLSA
jgi:hypothetical protein